jgi:amino acid adenylation domain-containing protein
VNSTAELLERLRSLDIRLTLDGDRLGVNAPRGALTPELREELGRRKDEVKAFLAARPRCDTAIPLNAVPRSARMPVSHTQQRLWFIKRMDPNGHVYNIAAALRMTGSLNHNSLERTLADLVARHESLRTRFYAIDGTPYCTIDAQARVTLEHLDLSALEATQRETAAQRALVSFSQRPFDIDRAPLLHCMLVRLASNHHLFGFVIDHIVSDGLSIGIFLNELTSLYAAHSGGAAAELPELPVQYYDYADWERRSFSQGALEEHINYWKRQLAGLPSLATLPADHPRPPVQTSRGARCHIQLPAALRPQLSALARAEGATLFMVLLSAFQILLYRFSGETDLPVGSAIANRNRAEVERVIGFFANNIVLRGDLSGDPTVRELIARTREMALKAYAHQDMPFDMLVEVLGTRRSLDHSPLFQVMFVLQSLQVTRFELPDLLCETVELPLPSARFDLTVDVFDLPAGLRVHFEYNTDLFEASTIDRLMQHFRHLLEAMVADPSACIRELPLLDEHGQRSMLLDWNRTHVPYPTEQTLHGLFEEQAARTPSAVALVFESTHLDYGTLNVRSNQVAHQLRAMGVGRESLVGVWMERSADMVVALLGVLKAGGAYVPLDPAFPKDRIDFMMADADLAVVLTHSHLAVTLDEGGPRAICLDSDAESLAEQPTINPSPLAVARDLAYVIYTSGSTGRPKGVMVEHRSVVNFLLSMHREPGISAADRFVSVTTLSFDIAGLEIHGPLTVGATVVLASRATALDGTRLAALLESSEATLLQATPATWRLLIETGWQGRKGMKMLCGGESLPRDLAGKLLELGGELWNMYGPTETTIWSTLTRVMDTTRAISIGRPIANTQVYVLEPSGLPAPIGVAGELCIAGDGLARGYRSRSDLTAEKFVTLDLPGVGERRVYRTGDLVRFLADGQLEFVGRRDNQVKIRGFRIELGEIEAVLAAHPGVGQCVIHVREDSPGDQRLVAYVVAAPNASPFDADATRAMLRSKLPEYMIPNIFVTLAALPLTPNGKIDRKALPMPQVQVSGAGAGEVVMTPVQRRVAALWQQVLGGERVGLYANFFDVGGHSLLLVKLQSALQREFGGELALVELFQRTTIAAQAERFDAPQATDAALRRAQARAARQTLNG